MNRVFYTLSPLQHGMTGFLDVRPWPSAETCGFFCETPEQGLKDAIESSVSLSGGICQGCGSCGAQTLLGQPASRLDTSYLLCICHHLYICHCMPCLGACLGYYLGCRHKNTCSDPILALAGLPPPVRAGIRATLRGCSRCAHTREGVCAAPDPFAPRDLPWSGAPRSPHPRRWRAHPPRGPPRHG